MTWNLKKVKQQPPAAGCGSCPKQDVYRAGAPIDRARGSEGDDGEVTAQPGIHGNLQHGTAGAGSIPLTVNDAHAAPAERVTDLQKLRQLIARRRLCQAMEIELGFDRYEPAAEPSEDLVLHAGPLKRERIRSRDAAHRRSLDQGHVGMVIGGVRPAGANPSLGLAFGGRAGGSHVNQRLDVAHRGSKLRRIIPQGGGHTRLKVAVFGHGNDSIGAGLPGLQYSHRGVTRHLLACFATQ